MKKFFRIITVFWGRIVKMVYKSSKFKEDFNDNELLWSFARSFHRVMLLSVLVQRERKISLLDKELKGIIVLIHHSFEGTCNLND